MMRGLSREQIEEQMEQLRAGSEQQAKEQLKTFFIMAKIAEKFEIDVSEEEINGYIAQLAVQRGQRPEKMREEMVRDGSLAQFKLQVREDKCVAKLLESAKITEIEPQKKVAAITAKKTTRKTASAEEKRSQKRKTTAQKRKPKGKNTR
jgi:FKBP-type peptidyl-prolyl cis-trans isomerase (trigger factor)